MFPFPSSAYVTSPPATFFSHTAAPYGPPFFAPLLPPQPGSFRHSTTTRPTGRPNFFAPCAMTLSLCLPSPLCSLMLPRPPFFRTPSPHRRRSGSFRTPTAQPFFAPYRPRSAGFSAILLDNFSETCYTDTGPAWLRCSPFQACGEQAPAPGSHANNVSPHQRTKLFFSRVSSLFCRRVLRQKTFDHRFNPLRI